MKICCEKCACFSSARPGCINLDCPCHVSEKERAKFEKSLLHLLSFNPPAEEVARIVSAELQALKSRLVEGLEKEKIIPIAGRMSDLLAYNKGLDQAIQLIEQEFKNI